MVKLRRLGGLVLVLGLGVVVSGAGNPGGNAAPPAVGPQEVSVIGVFSDPNGHHGVMIEGKRDRRRVLMLIGSAEATAIAVPLEHVTPPRPLTTMKPNDKPNRWPIFSLLNIAVAPQILKLASAYRCRFVGINRIEGL